MLDPSQGFDAVADVAFERGRVARLAPEIAPDRARAVYDAEGLLVVPGLIDLHVHVHWGVSHYGIDADLGCLAQGATTVVDAGSAGGYAYPSLKRYVIEGYVDPAAYFNQLPPPPGEEPRLTNQACAAIEEIWIG
ncbi:MAG: hypothetical protein H5T66_10270, partial [Chloroflexi bacterium]|nr:hypothetical protein [Chloroflexota bacterium]